MTLITPKNRSSNLPQRRRFRVAKSFVFGSVLTGLSVISFVASPNSAAAETACDTYLPDCGASLCDCGQCGNSNVLTQNPLYRSLDTVAGGIEKLLGLDRCKNAKCKSNTCDCGRDSGDWMMDSNVMLIPAATMPAMPAIKPHVVVPTFPVVPPLAPAPSGLEFSKPRIMAPETDYFQPSIAPPTPAPRNVDTFKSAPPKDKPGAAKTPPVPEMTKPRIVPAEAPTLPPPRSNSKATDVIEVPPQMPVEPEPKKEGSIFDALDDLDDPFEEDAVRLRRQFGSIRPMLQNWTKQTTPSYRPVYRRPSQVVGSGLKPVRSTASLRSVSHEEPIEFRPIVNKRVLAPYRPSR